MPVLPTVTGLVMFDSHDLDSTKAMRGDEDKIGNTTKLHDEGNMRIENVQQSGFKLNFFPHVEMVKSVGDVDHDNFE